MAIGPFQTWNYFQGDWVWPYTTKPKSLPYIEDDPEAWEYHPLMGWTYMEWMKIPERQRLYCPTVWEHLRLER